MAKILTKIEQMTLRMKQSRSHSTSAHGRLKYGAERPLASLELPGTPETLHRDTPGAVCRDLLSAFFRRLII